MWYLYLDESGDLGFDFVNKDPSDYFTVCILATSSKESFRRIIIAVRKTLQNKLNKPKSNLIVELKASQTAFGVKEYFYRLVQKEQFGIYAITLNKRRVYERLTRDKSRVYNWIARKVLDLIPFESATDRVQLVLDKSKGKREIDEFNSYIKGALQGRINPKIPLSIHHLDSQKDKVLQAVDLFCWGIFRKYEKRDTEWFDVFREKIIYEEQYL